jgi:hypothetical protein
MDYVTLEGIENRTGIEKQNLYRSVLKELLDNGVDPEETQYRSQEDENNNTASPQLEVTVSKEPNYLYVLVRNSNHSGKGAFTKEMLGC